MASIKSVLVANRGEIACRIFRSCRELGIETVAVFSEADAGAVHVAEADRALPIGPAKASESYLRGERIIAAALEAGADAIHPGYGFLSESSAFAEAVEAAGLTWIGPTPATIRSMGDKARARALAQAAGVPVVPGSGALSPGAEAGAEHICGADLVPIGAGVGYPLLVKAAAGGGGIGMRRVDDPSALAGAVEATRNMASKAFGDGTVFLERFIARARHIEMQVFGFGNGEAVHLGERDCSVQRRFQKVIEESPAPGLSAGTRARMAEAALALACSMNYRGAGTVEFILDVSPDAGAGEQAFYFLEMNTRIQVEHPVTEMVTGRDLVAMQLAHAGGGLIGLAQSEIVSRGASIECRLYAENPDKNFWPSPGPLTVFRLAEPSADLRIDCGYRQGDQVTPFYDPMLAKIIAFGATREDARLRAVAALRSCQIEGIKTNRDFLIACLERTDYIAGDLDTGFIERRRGNA